MELALPPGSPLDEVRLSQQFVMSRTPIREALVRLAADGLVTTLPNRSTIVSPIDFERLPVYFEALSLTYVDEHEAMVKAIEKGNAELCDRLGAAHATQIVRQIQD